MLIRLDNAALIDDLCAHFARSGYTAEAVGGGMVDVGWPSTLDERDLREQIALHLRIWQIGNSSAGAELV